MSSSRTSRFKELRDTIKDDSMNENKKVVLEENDEEDNFLDFIDKEKEDHTHFDDSTNSVFEPLETKEPINVEDTLHESKTYSQLKQDEDPSVKRALKNAKSSVGENDDYNTRMDILNKIRNPKNNSDDLGEINEMDTAQLSKGFFINKENIYKEETQEINLDETKESKILLDSLEEETIKDDDNQDEENNVESSDDSSKEEVEDRVFLFEPNSVESSDDNRKNLSLLEKLASMSPKKDVEEARRLLGAYDGEEDTKEPTVDIESTQSLEEMIGKIKEKDQQMIKDAGKSIPYNQKNRMDDNEEYSKGEMVMNYVIIALIIVFVIICGMIGYQLLFN